VIRFHSLFVPLLALTTFACAIKPPRQGGVLELHGSRVALAMLSSSDLRNVPVAQVGNEAQAMPLQAELAKAAEQEDDAKDAQEEVTDEDEEANESPVIELDEVASEDGVVDLGDIDDPQPQPQPPPKAKTQSQTVVDLGDIDDPQPQPQPPPKAKAKTESATAVVDLGDIDEPQPQREPAAAKAKAAPAKPVSSE
jgi:outer membrane biosynthesis protein TonB